MAKGEYIGVSGKAKKVKKMYVGIGGKAKKVKKAYIGVNGKAKLCWSGADGTFLITYDNVLNYAKLDRSSLTLTFIDTGSNSYNYTNPVFCQGRWFIVKRQGYDSAYVCYSTDAVNWTNIPLGVGYKNASLCADSEYVYVKTAYESTTNLIAINAATLALTTIISFDSYNGYNNNACIAYDGKVLLGYYANQQRYTAVITRNGSTFSRANISGGGNGKTYPYASSSDKTLIPSFSNGGVLAYYKNGAITVTSTPYYSNGNYGAGLVYGNGKFSDGEQVSTDGITWGSTPVYQDYDNNQLVGYGDGVFIKFKPSTSYYVTLCYSEDGVNWVDIATIYTGVGQNFSNRSLYCAYDKAYSYGDK